MREQTHKDRGHHVDRCNPEQNEPELLVRAVDPRHLVASVGQRDPSLLWRHITHLATIACSFRFGKNMPLKKVPVSAGLRLAELLTQLCDDSQLLLSAVGVEGHR